MRAPCFIHEIRGWIAEKLGIRRERLISQTVCAPDCCGHGHIYCKEEDYGKKQTAPRVQPEPYNPIRDLYNQGE